MEIEREKLGNYYDKAYTDLKSTADSLHVMNVKRHELEDELQNEKNKNQMLLECIAQNEDRIKSL